MTEAPTIDIRSEAVKWLEDELKVMNDNGSHWVRKHYAEMINGELVMCIKGASNFTLLQRLGGLKDDFLHSLKKRWWWGDDETFDVTLIVGESGMLRRAIEEDSSFNKWIAVQDAVEIALNIAIARLTKDDEIARNTEEGESVITGFNDNFADWERVVEVHEMAITIVKDEAMPLTWEEYGKTLSAA